MSSNSTEGGPAAGEHPQGNSTAGGGGGGHGHWGADPGRQAMFAMRLLLNLKSAEYYAAALCGIIAIFTVLHWGRLLVNRTKLPQTPFARPFTLISRRVRNILVRAATGFNSAGHGLLVALYVAINLAIIFTNVDTSSPGPVASRFGWMLSANTCFVVFLALKNTPLAFLTSYSYERLNNLHQIAGCTTFLLLILHSVSYTVFFYSHGRVEVLREREQIAGIIAGFGFLSMFLSAMLIRRFAYETFYTMHILSFIASIICIGFHRPDFITRTPVVTCITAGMFAADRILRLTRFLANSVNNEATVYPLPNGGTRILLSKKPLRAVPGKHCFVWIPKIRMLEMHPFSIISTSPMEFVAKSYDGFTRDLHAYASAHPGARLRASVEGPYGTFPDPMRYDKVILIAGGSGASYTFGLAVNMLDRMNAESTKSIVFIWTAKTHEDLTWFAEHLNTLRTHPNAPKVVVSLYVSRAPGSSSSGERQAASTPPLRRLTVSSRETSSEAPSPTSPDMEKGLPRAPAATTTMTTGGGGDGDIEKEIVREEHEHVHVAASPTATVGESNTNVSETSPLRHAVSSGRPDTATVIFDAVASTPADQRVLVAACGPPGLMRVVRNAAARCIRGDGPGVELHCEQFGW